MQNEEFKLAVGKFPTGVTVITTNQGSKLYGFTANSFASVSLEPHLISFCLNKEAYSFDAFSDAEYFSISILSSAQADISGHFARHSADKFKGVDYELGKHSNSPLIQGAICFIECKKYNIFECGDHSIFIGEVIKTQIDEDKSPLLYFSKSYLEIK